MQTISDIESEQLVIGTLLSGAADVDDWVSLLTPDCFTDPRCGAIYQAMQEIVARGDQVNDIAVYDQIRLNNARVTVDIADIMLMERQSRPENLRQATAVLHQMRVRRMLLHLCSVIETRALDIYNSPVEQIVEQVQTVLDTLDIAPMSHGKSLNDLAPELRQRIAENLNPDTRHVGPLTGFHTIDNEAPLPESGLVVLGGYTSHGKSAMANQIALVNALQGMKVAIFSKEMTNLETLSRMVSMGTEDTSASWIMNRPLDALHYEQALTCLQRLQTECGDRVFFDDSRSLQLDEVISNIRRLHKEHGIKLAFVDYLQLLTYDTQRNRNVTQEQQMGYYSRTFKNLGDRLGILVIALSQLNRNMQHMRPSLMVIRDSGQIAEAADYVLFVWRPWVNHLQYDGNFVSYPTENTAMLIVAKNRQGPLAEILVGWRSLTTSFHDLSPEQLAALLSGEDPVGKTLTKAEAKAAAIAKAKQLQQTLFDEE